MKKYFSFVTSLALVLGFTACEDVPEPYEIPSEQTETPTGDELLSETFASSLGSFSNVTTGGEGEWKIEFSTAKASGYNKDTQKTIAGTYYLISPEINLSGIDAAHVMFEYILAYNKGAENQQLLITDKFDAAKPAEGWTLMSQDWKEPNKKENGKIDWKTFHTATINLPARFVGKKVRIAFRYNTNATSGSTWEVKNLKVKKGNVEQPAPPQPPTGSNLLANGDFETWVEGSPVNWKSAGNAGTAKLSQSTTARNGQFSVKVEGHAEQNKRLAYKELTLKAGTYHISFHVRGEADGASCRPGYVPVVAGTVDSQGYQYGNYVNDIKATEWTAVNHSFTLGAETTVCLVVMNPKGKGNLLIDDFSLTTTDGAIIEPTTPEPDNAIYQNDLMSNIDGWTLLQGNLPTELTYVWALQSGKYLKASAYKGKAYASEAYAVSPLIPLGTASILTFDHTANYLKGAQLTDLCSLLIREGENGQWQPLAIPTLPAGTNWTFVSSGDINLSAYAGKSVQFAFKYTSTAATACTWEIKNFKVK